MSRVRKLAEGDKLKAPKKETKLFETARGNINFDDFYNYQLSALDDDIKLSGLTGANADAYRNEAIKYLDSIKSGNISKMNSDRSFVMNDATNFTDYKNFQPKVDRSNWWERNIEGKGDSYIQDEDYARSQAVENLSKKLNSWNVYTPESEKEKKKASFLYNYDKANPDLARNVFRGGDWDANTWAGYDDKTRMSYIGNTIQDKINSLASDDTDYDFKSKMGFENADAWKAAANRVVELSKTGKLDNDYYNALQGAGLGGFRQLLDKNYSPDGTPRPAQVDSNTSQDPSQVQKVTENGQDVYKVWNPETNSLVNYNGVSENPFDSDFGKIYYNGKLYNSYSDITDPNANLESIIDNYNEVQDREKNAKYFDFNRGFGKGHDYMLRNDIDQLSNIQWSDNQKRNQVLDRSQAFSGLSAGNRFYSFKGNGVNAKHLIFDKDLNRNIEVDKVTKRQGIYFAEGKNGKQYLLGKYDPKVDGTNEGLIGGNNARIIRNVGISSNDYNDEDKTALNAALNRRFYEFLNYTSSDTDVNKTLEWLTMSDNYQKGNMRVDKNTLSNPESAQYKIWKPIIDKYKLNPDTSGIYTIPLNYLIENMGKKITGRTSRDTKETRIPIINTRILGYDSKDYPIVGTLGGSKYATTTFKNPIKRKDGGTLKYQKGGYVFDGGYTPENNTSPTVASTQYGSMNNWDNMTGDEKTILMATLADIGSMAASFVPGANLGAAAVGAGASIARRVAGGSSNLEFAGDLALDALSLIPGAKLAKATKSFGKLGKIMAKSLPAGMFIMSAGQVLGNTDEYSKLINKVNKDGITSLNVDDWKRVATLTGALVSGRATFKTSIPEAAKALNNKTFNKLVFKNNTVSNSVGVDIKGKNFTVPVSDAIAKNSKGVNKKSAESFTKEVNDYLNTEISKYTKDVNGKLMINKNAPEWAKNAASAGKNEQGGWNFTISDNAKVGRIPFRKAEIPKITSTADGSNVRRIFSLRPKDQRTARQIDYTVDKMADPSGNNSLYRQWYPKQGENGTRISDNTSTASSVADSGIKPDVSSVTRPILGLPEGKPIPGPIITPAPANSQINIPDRIHRMFNGTDVGTIKEVKIGNKTYFAERGSTGEARLLSQGDPKIDAYTTRLAEQRLQSLERGRQTRENNKLKVQQDKDLLAGQIDDRILSRLNAKERLETMKETKELNETIKKQTKQLADKPKTDKSNKNKKPKKTSRDDKGIQRRKEGGVLKYESGSKFYNTLYQNNPLLNINTNQPFEIPASTVTSSSNRNPLLLNAPKSQSYLDILSGKTAVNPNIAPKTQSVLGTVSSKKSEAPLRPGNSLLSKVNSSSLLNAANLATGLYMGKQAYDAARKFQPTMLDAPNINARAPQGNEVLNQFYRNSGLGVLNRLNKTASSDQNYNTAALLEGTRYANEMAEKGALANDQEIKRTTELADRIEQQNIANRSNVANQNNASMINSINMKNDLKSRYIGNMYNTLINPYMMEMRQRANQKEVMADQIALEELNKMPYRNYETEVNNLNTKMSDAYNLWKGSDTTRTEEQFRNSSEYKDLLKTMTGLRTKATQTYQDAILANRKKMLGNSFFAKGGKVNNYVSYLKEFNKNLEKSEERYRLDVQKALDRAAKNSIENTKLAKNLIFKIK